ncbi:MAG: dockerin type I repeat-containing protein [Porphyromonadaceae bacterium]|nr:MAG: dockerin type I repeat-containing protein [Porphyromonadaceae bacterium]
MAGMTSLDTIKAHSDAVPALGDSVWAGIDQPNVKLDLTNMALAEDFAHAAQWEHFHILKNYLLGDVNGDGNLDVADVTLLISYILGEKPKSIPLGIGKHHRRRRDRRNRRFGAHQHDSQWRPNNHPPHPRHPTHHHPPLTPPPTNNITVSPCPPTSRGETAFMHSRTPHQNFCAEMLNLKRKFFSNK